MDGVVHIQNMFPTYQTKIFIWVLWVLPFCIQWIGLRKNLQQTMDFPMKYGVSNFFPETNPYQSIIDDVRIFWVCPCCTTK